MRYSCALLLLSAASFGCSQRNDGESRSVERAPEKKSESSLITDKITELYEQAKESGATTASSAAEWAGERFSQAADVSSDAASDSAGWIQNMYEKAKKSGETSASSAKEWVTSDLAKSGTWQYKVVVIESDNLEEIQRKLNELGSERWECYSIVGQRYHFKRPQHSTLRQLPAKELLRLLPLLGSLGGDDSN